MEPSQNNQNVESVSKNDGAVWDKPKGNKGLAIGMICLALLAVGGISFGVWAMLDGNTKVGQLNSQIDSLKQQNEELKSKINDAVADVEIDTDDDDVKAADYIYVGEWGIKIKVPENWRGIIEKYAYYNDYPQAIDTLSIKEKSEPPLANAVFRYYGEQDCNDTIRGMCFSIDGKNYSVDFNASCSDSFIEHFKNEDIYSKI